MECSVCGTLEGKERSAAPVVEFLGYSVSESGNRAVVTGVRFNYTSLKLYEEINGEELEGTYDVGSNTKLALSGREVYGSAEEGNEATE